MNVMDSYWDMLPPELHEIILLYKRNQEMFDLEKERRMEMLGQEIKLYKELKDKWALGHIRCIVKKTCDVRIMGCYVDRVGRVNRESFFLFNFKSALQRLNHVKSFM